MKSPTVRYRYFNLLFFKLLLSISVSVLQRDTGVSSYRTLVCITNIITERRFYDIPPPKIPLGKFTLEKPSLI